MQPILRSFLGGVVATLLPLAAEAAVLVFDTPVDPVGITGDDIARVLDGAEIAALAASGRSVVEMTGGRVDAYALSGDAMATLAGGAIGTVDLSGRARVAFDGSYHGTRVTLSGESRADVRGGYFLPGSFLLSDTATVHVYGSGFTFAGGGLRGSLDDGMPFDRTVLRMDDPMAEFRNLMPDGLCVHTGGNEYCGPTLFYSTLSGGGNGFELRGDERIRIVDGGAAGRVSLAGRATGEMSGGSTFGLLLQDDSRFAMSGGRVDDAMVTGNSHVTIRGGTVNGRVDLYDGGTVDVEAADARFLGSRLEGTYRDGTTFGITFTKNGRFGSVLAEGVCIVLGDRSHCGPEIFYASMDVNLSTDERASIVDGGSVGMLNAQGNAAVRMSGGTVGMLQLADDASLEATGGTISSLLLRGRSRAGLDGVSVQFLQVAEDADLEFGRISGLQSLDLFYLAGGHVRIHVRSAAYEEWQRQLAGEWLDGSAFRFNVIGPAGSIDGVLPSAITIVAVPEPGTWALFALGLGVLGFAGRRRRDAA